MKMTQVYFVLTENLAGLTLKHATVSFFKDPTLAQIEYVYDDNINDEVKREAEWFDRLTYTF